MIEHCTLAGFGRQACGTEMVVRQAATGGTVRVCPRCDGPAADPTKTNPSFNKLWPRTADE